MAHRSTRTQSRRTSGGQRPIDIERRIEKMRPRRMEPDGIEVTAGVFGPELLAEAVKDLQLTAAVGGMLAMFRMMAGHPDHADWPGPERPAMPAEVVQWADDCATYLHNKIQEF